MMDSATKKLHDSEALSSENLTVRSRLSQSRVVVVLACSCAAAVFLACVCLYRLSVLERKIDALQCQLNSDGLAARVDTGNLPATMTRQDNEIDDDDGEDLRKTVSRKRRHAPTSRCRNRHRHGTAHFNLAIDSNANDETINFSFARWSQVRSRPSLNFEMNAQNTNIVIRDPGTFFVYAQLMYYNAEPHNSFQLNVTSRGGNRRMIATCANSMPYVSHTVSSEGNNFQKKSCYTGAVARLSDGDTVTIHNMRPGSLLAKNAQGTFIGFIKLS